VILEVLDARDPLGCRCPEVEQRIVGELSARSPRSKRVVLVLNKIGMLPSFFLFSAVFSLWPTSHRFARCAALF
jgi:ribosome biogenesis GTPase A